MKVEICKTCEGNGEVLVRGERGEGDYYEQCSVCEGTGREIVIEYSVRGPFSKKHLYDYKIDTEIHNLLRKQFKPKL